MKMFMGFALFCISGVAAMIATQALMTQMGFGVLVSNSMILDEYAAGAGVQAAFWIRSRGYCVCWGWACHPKRTAVDVRLTSLPLRSCASRILSFHVRSFDPQQA